MRILRFAPYITITTVREFTRNKTGFGRSVFDIARFSVLSGNEEHVFTYNNYKKKSIEGVNIVRFPRTQLLKGINIKSLVMSYRFNQSYGGGILHYFKYQLACNYLAHLIHKIQPDIIHIHGVGANIIPFIRVASEAKIPIVMTLHGLNYNDDRVRLSPGARELEKRIIYLLNKEGIIITTIGSVLKSKIVQDLALQKHENIIPIPHGVDSTKFFKIQERSAIYKKYNLPNDKKIILNVGSLLRVKNQSFLIKAFAALPDDTRKSTYLLFVGEGPEKEQYQKEIEFNGLSSNVKILGYLNEQSLNELYNISHLLAVVSTSEGFGRPMLEAFSTGVPVITFNDLGAIPDIYNERAMVRVSRDDTRKFSLYLSYALEKVWDKNEICQVSLLHQWNNRIGMYNHVYDLAKKLNVSCENLIYSLN